MAAVYHTFKSGRFSPTASVNTFAEGVATRVPFALPYKILSAGLDVIILVSDREICLAIRLYLATIHQLAEEAGGRRWVLSKLATVSPEKSGAYPKCGNLTLEILCECLK